MIQLRKRWIDFGRLIQFAALAAMLASCGGGGGGGNSTPAPTVTMAISAGKVMLGGSATITWSSTNATSCSASGAWHGTEAVSGSVSETPSVSGALTYTLTCDGAGGNQTASVGLAVPVPVAKSSYENKVQYAAVLGPQPESGLAYAFGDFFQDGSLSMVTNTQVYDSTQPYVAGSANATNFGQIHFFKLVNGAWIDHTSDILANTVGCLHPRKLIVADFNGDGVPDIYFSCTGYDNLPFPGEQPHVLLSQADGSYNNTMLPFDCYCHGASAADFQNNGYADIVIVDPNVHQQPYFLVNNQDGTFTADYTRMPVSTAPTSNGCGIPCGLAIFSIELIDFNADGRYDLWVGGTDDGSNQAFQASLYLNDGTNSWAAAQRTILPSAGAADSANTLPLDILFLNQNIYLERINATYADESIQKIAYPTLSAATIYTHSGNFPNGSSWFPWIIPYQGNIVSMDSSYTASISQ